MAKNKHEYWFIGQSEKLMKAENWKCDIVYSIFPIINISFYLNFFSSFHHYHLYQTIDVKPLFFIIYFFNTFPEV